MKKIKKALLAALIGSVIFAGALGLAACDNGNGGGGDAHTHTWSWEVTTAPTDSTTGTATGTCSGSGTCDATAEEKTATLPVLTSSDYTKTTKTAANCTTDGVITYKYDKDNVKAEFDVNIGKAANAHDYNYTSNGPAGHSGVCSRDEAHTLTNEAHDTKGENGACSKCGVVKVNITEAETQPSTGKRYKLVAEKSGYYEIWGESIVLLPNAAAAAIGINIGTLNQDGTLKGLDKLTIELYLWAGTYYIDATTSEDFEVVLVKEHEHTAKTEWKSDARGHWHEATCHEGAIVDFAEHTFGEWSLPDEEGTASRTCDCGYAEYKIVGTPVHGETDGMSGLTTSISVAETGNYIATIEAEREEGFGENYIVLAQFFDMTNQSGAKKSYTFKVLSGNTQLMLYVGEDTIYLTEKGATHTIELEAGDTFYFDVSTNDEEGYEGYSVEAAFRIIVEDAA